jgi:hypothetical protein
MNKMKMNIMNDILGSEKSNQFCSISNRCSQDATTVKHADNTDFTDFRSLLQTQFDLSLSSISCTKDFRPTVERQTTCELCLTSTRFPQAVTTGNPRKSLKSASSACLTSDLGAARGIGIEEGATQGNRRQPFHTSYFK